MFAFFIFVYAWAFLAWWLFGNRVGGTLTIGITMLTVWMFTVLVGGLTTYFDGGPSDTLKSFELFTVFSDWAFSLNSLIRMSAVAPICVFMDAAVSAWKFQWHEFSFWMLVFLSWGGYINYKLWLVLKDFYKGLDEDDAREAAAN